MKHLLSDLYEDPTGVLVEPDHTVVIDVADNLLLGPSESIPENTECLIVRTQVIVKTLASIEVVHNDDHIGIQLVS